MAECQNYANKLHFVKSNEDVNNHFILMRIIYLIQQDVFQNIKFFNNQKDPINFCIQTLVNIFKPFEGNKNIWGIESLEKDNFLSNGDLGFLDKSLKPF